LRYCPTDVPDKAASAHIRASNFRTDTNNVTRPDHIKTGIKSQGDIAAAGGVI